MWLSLPEATVSGAVEYFIENPMTPARGWTRLKQRYAPSTSSRIAGIQRSPHETQMEGNEDPLNILGLFEEKQDPLKRSGDSISDQQLLLLFLLALPES